MGTRAQFFINDPRDLENRVWLGTTAWDGYPDGDIGERMQAVRSQAEFMLVMGEIAKRDDFCDPQKRSFPFPWKDDLFLTDCTYAWFDGAVQFTWFHRGFVTLKEYSADPEAYDDGEDTLSSNVPAPDSDKPKGPDSIIVISAGG